MLVLLKTQQREYWRALHNEFKLARQSRTDAFTQLFNRRFFDEKLKEFGNMLSRNRGPLTIMLIDCDLFKRINDNYGHDIGDECLKYLAQLFTEVLTRSTDFCARYGGEEFSVILPGVDSKGCKIVAERIRKKSKTHHCRLMATSFR